MTISVAVTAVGGGVGQSVLKSLKGTDYRTVAIDPDRRAVGLSLANIGYRGYPVSDERFVERLVDICMAEDCKYLFSGFDAELPVLARNRQAFEDKGIRLILSEPSVVNLSDNKLELFHFMRANNFCVIPTVTSVEEAEKCKVVPPYIVKPAVGCRSQGVERFEKLEQVDAHLKKNPDKALLIQQYIEGPEYTCGSVSFDGNVLGVIAMTRELRNGDTYKAKVDQNPIVVDFVTRLMEKIKPFGPCNVQLRLKFGIPYVLEINARCSGTTGARAKCGFNEPQLTLDHLEGKPTSFRILPMEVSRYWEEVVRFSTAHLDMDGNLI